MKSSALDISLWIREYATKNRIESLIVGVSGGIDSALVSTLCAISGMKTCVLSMPIKQAPDQLRRAHEHIDWLKSNFSNVNSIYVDLTHVFETFETTMKEQAMEDDLAFANSRSRLRMITLYQAATVHKGIVVGTGNKVEDFGVGFFTKYGDGGVDISPIADLTKTQVREMARSLGIIDSILLAKPTDGLWEDERNDEDQIGAAYEELEWAMEYIEQKPYYSPADLEKLSTREREVLVIYKNFHTKNLHKMQSIPVYKQIKTHD
jgi:NAD+ synthase